MKEVALRLGATGSLVGIMADPPAERVTRDFPVIVLLNAGMLHRVGPNRLYVKIARELAMLGFSVLRFDFSGIGDSRARTDHLTLEVGWLAEIQEVFDWLVESRGSDRFALIGICSGATFSFKTICRDERVAGAVLINPQDHLHDGSEARLDAYIRNRVNARHNWRIGLFSSFRGRKWLKAARGEVDYRSVARLIGFQLKNLFRSGAEVSSRGDDVGRNLARLADRGVHLLHVYSEGDPGLDYLHLMLGARVRKWGQCGLLKVETVPGSNHAFTLLERQERLIGVIRGWALEMAGSALGEPRPLHSVMQ